MGRYKNIQGKQFGRWTVVEFVGRVANKTGKSSASVWKCRCECGTERNVTYANLTSGRSLSCGCLNREICSSMDKSTHGMSRARVYNLWNKMKQRCYTKTNPSYKWYGGRGISVCDEWKSSFESFYQWSVEHGYKDTLSIDRIDVNGDYCPKNCRWVTMKQQENNRRDNVIFEYNGQIKTISEWADLYGLKYTTLFRRIERGWSIEKALTTPIKHHKGGATYG